MTTKNPWIPAIVMSTLTLGAGIGIGVYAQTAPSASWPLYYSGAIEAEGKAPSGTYAITVEIWEKEVDGTQQCTRTDPSVEVANGRFRVDLSSCADKIRSLKDAWIRTSFTGPDGLTRDIVKRAKLGAVPFSLEAEHAAAASTATVGSGLDTRLQGLEQRISAWKSETVQVTRANTNATVAGSTTTLHHRTVGGTMQLAVRTFLASGLPTGTHLRWPLPQGYVFDTDAIPVGLFLGAGGVWNGGSSLATLSCFADGDKIACNANGTATYLGLNDSPFALGNGANISFQLNVPVKAQ